MYFAVLTAFLFLASCLTDVSDMRWFIENICILTYLIAKLKPKLMKLNERVFKYYMNVPPFIDFDYTGTIEFLQCTIYYPLTVWGEKKLTLFGKWKKILL